MAITTTTTTPSYVSVDGRVRYFVCGNNGSAATQTLLWLNDFAEVLASRVPMLKETLVREVSDNIAHKTVLAVADHKVIGGLTYHAHHRHGFGEVHFLAVAFGEERRGMGNRLMNILKTYAREVDVLTQLVVFAYDYSVGFFVKQGFRSMTSMETENSQMCSSRFYYQPAHIPMEYKLDRFVTYLPSTYSTVSSSGGDTVPVPMQTDVDVPPHLLHPFMRVVARAVKQHPDARPFLYPVDRDTSPGYYSVVREPMDLKMVTERIESEVYYTSLTMLVNELRKIFHNGRLYRDHGMFANRLEVFFWDQLRDELENVRKLMDSDDDCVSIISGSSDTEEDNREIERE